MNPAQRSRGLDRALDGPWWWLLPWLLALGLAWAGLGHLPLRDWDEAIAARVALELSHQPLGPEMVLPTIWGEPYLNKPPGLHLLIAGVIRLWRWLAGDGPQSLPPAWLIRLVPAFLSSLVVPLAGLIQRELRPRDPLSSLLTPVILLTLLPIARHGRLAMLDGTQLSAIALLWLCLLRTRGGGRSLLIWGSLAGLAGSALLLLKAPMLLPALAAGLLALRLDPAARTLRWGPLAAALLLGLVPGLAWHLFHLTARGGAALHLWLGDGALRVLTDAGEGSQQGWRLPVLKMLEGGWPWLLFWPFGLGLCWRARRSPEGSWPLVLQGVMALSILPLRTQLPWYSHPLWLPAALLIGPVVAWLIRGREAGGTPRPPAAALLAWVPAFLALLGALLLVLGIGVAAMLPVLRSYGPYLIAAGAGWLAGGLFLWRGRRPQRELGALLIAGGNGLALLLLMLGPHWNWELAERWPVQPVAALVQQHAPGKVWIWREDSRPSLDWYAQRRISRLRRDQAEAPGLSAWILCHERHRSELPGSCRSVGAADGWLLLHCQP